MAKCLFFQFFSRLSKLFYKIENSLATSFFYSDEGLRSATSVKEKLALLSSLIFLQLFFRIIINWTFFVNMNLNKRSECMFSLLLFYRDDSSILS